MPEAEGLQHMAHETSAWQLAWLHERCAGWGFALDGSEPEVLHNEWITWPDPDAP